MLRCWLAAALAAGLLAGCAGGTRMLATSRQELQDAPVCCGSLATARRLQLPVEPVEVVIDHTAQAFDFDGGKAFFVLYELPPFRDAYSIVLTSLAEGTVEDSAVFMPRVATDDADFRRVRLFDEKTLRSRGNNLERTVFVNPADRAERYLVIYGSGSSATVRRAYSMNTMTPIVAGPAIFYLHGGKDGTSVLRSSPGGKLQLEVRGLKPPSAH